MKRSEWVPFDWGAVASLVVLVVILLVDLLRRQSLTARTTADVRTPPQLH